MASLTTEQNPRAAQPLMEENTTVAKALKQHLWQVFQSSTIKLSHEDPTKKHGQNRHNLTISEKDHFRSKSWC